MIGPDPCALLRQMFDAAIDAAQPARCLPPYLARHLPQQPVSAGGRLIVLGAGKAAAAMARVVEDHVPDPVRAAMTGLAVTRYGHGVPCERIEIIEAAHPVPDEAGEAAARRIRDLAAEAGPQDTVLCLISGGGSALLALPALGLSFADKQQVNRLLLVSGARISEINCVRRHLSDVKGGRLAALAHPARVVSLLMSDVPGDWPGDIASGPTVADETSCQDALDILDQYRIALPLGVRALLESGRGESIKPSDPRMAGVVNAVIITPQQALEAAADVARRAGYAVHILGDALEGEARDMGVVIAGITRQIRTRNQPFRAPCVLLSGGEASVTVRGQGRGGRNVEFLLALGLALEDIAGVWALAGDTDGVDGQEEIAGALLTPDTLPRARALGLNPAKSLANNDGHGFFGALGDSIITGPTLTNVNDFRAVVIGQG